MLRAAVAVVFLLVISASSGAAPQSTPSPEVPATTKVLSEATTIHLSIAPDGTTFTFARITPEIAALAPGDVIVSGVCATARYGFLKRVIAVSITDGGMRVATAAATLRDAIPGGTVHVSGTLTPDQIEQSLLAPGVTMDAPAAAARVTLARHTFSLNNFVVHDTDANPFTLHDQIRTTGSVSVEMSYDYTSDVATGGERLEITVDDEADVRFDAEAAIELPRSSRPIATHVYAPIQFSLFGLPVVLVPVLTLEVGIEGRLAVDVSVGMTHEGSATGVVTRSGSTLSFTTGESSYSEFGPIYSAVRGDVLLEAFLGPRLALRLYHPHGYGIFGELDAFLRFTATIADPPPEPWWALRAGLELAAGVVTPDDADRLAVMPIGEPVLLASSRVDPDDDTCGSPPIFRLDQYRPVLWGGIDALADHDWATITAPPGATKMLVALSIVGRKAEEIRKPNYDLELRRPGGCSAPLPLARSSTTRQPWAGCDADCQAGNGAWGDERILVDVTGGETYRSGVMGRTWLDYVEEPPGIPNTNYQLAIAFGNQNRAFGLLSKVVDYDPTPVDGAPAGVLNVTLEFQNLTGAEFRNFTFLVRQLSSDHTLLSATVKTKTQPARPITLDVDNGSVRSSGATVSVPNMAFCYAGVISSMCALQEYGNVNTSNEPDDRFKITFRLGALAKQPLRAFATDIYATRVVPVR